MLNKLLTIPLKKILGSAECCSLPALNLPLINAKVDTGAKTSALYALNIEKFTRKRQKWVRFSVLPVQHIKQIKVDCEAPILTERNVKNSSGHTEKRIVIYTELKIGNSLKKKVELTLSTSRDSLSYRMLLGRSSMLGFFVNPAKPYCQGRITKSIFKNTYQDKLNK